MMITGIFVYVTKHSVSNCLIHNYYVKIDYSCACYHVFYRTPFCGGNEERTKENILSYSYRPMYDYEIFSFAGEMFIDSCLRYLSLLAYSINKSSLHMHSDT